MSNKISDNLEKLREKKGYSLEKVARFADLSLNTVVTVESDANPNPTIETLTRIAKALEVGVDELIE
ncbi:MAG: helix-turn-helix domain-containing protein [bacterium]